MLTVVSDPEAQSPYVETPNIRLFATASNATPAYCTSAARVEFTGSAGLAICSSNGITSDVSSFGNVPVQTGGARMPVQTPVPLSASVPLPVTPAPFATAGPLIVDAG